MAIRDHIPKSCEVARQVGNKQRATKQQAQREAGPTEAKGIESKSSFTNSVTVKMPLTEITETSLIPYSSHDNSGQ